MSEPTDEPPVEEQQMSELTYEEYVTALLQAGLSPCLIEVGEDGREVDQWGNVVNRQEVLRRASEAKAARE